MELVGLRVHVAFCWTESVITHAVFNAESNAIHLSLFSMEFRGTEVRVGGIPLIVIQTVPARKKVQINKRLDMPYLNTGLRLQEVCVT